MAVKTVQEYLSSLSPDRLEAIKKLRSVVKKNLPKGYEEGIQYGMIGYYVPHSIYPAGYHCDSSQPLPFAQIASQKSYIALHLFCIYGHDELQSWFREEYAKTGKRLNMGKSCVRFRSIDDIPFELIGKTVKRIPVRKFIDHYETAIASGGKRRTSTKTEASPQKAAKTRTAKKSTTKAVKSSVKNSTTKKKLAKKKTAKPK
ncbi:MAG: DUF1801 domain-containing protein [Aureliella sp.]